MPSDYRRESSIPPHPDVPDETRDRLVERLLARDLAQAKSLHRAAASRAKLLAKYRSEVESLFGGAAKYRRFRDYAEKASQDEATKLLTPDGLPLSREEQDKLVAKRWAAGDAYVAKLGVSADKLQALHERWAKRFEAPLDASGADHAKLVPTGKVTKEILQRKTNPWTVRTPPYDGWEMWTWWLAYNNMWWDDYGRSRWADPVTGLTGDYVGLADIAGATDSDKGWAQNRDLVGFWYQMEAAGLVEMWVEAQMALNRHHYDSWVRWAWTKKWSFRQDNYIFMQSESDARGGTGAAAATSLMLGSDSWHEAHWDESYRPNGEIAWFHYTSDVSYAPGEWVWVQAGNQNTMEAFCDDFECDSWMEFRWFIKSIHVHSTGGS